MTITTKKTKLDFMIMKGDAKIMSRVPDEMKKLLKETADRQNMTSSTYIKLAVTEKLANDLIMG